MVLPPNIFGSTRLTNRSRADSRKKGSVANCEEAGDRPFTVGNRAIGV
jgi:hypothetical protein